MALKDAFITPRKSCEEGESLGVAPSMVPCCMVSVEPEEGLVCRLNLPELEFSDGVLRWMRRIALSKLSACENTIGPGLRAVAANKTRLFWRVRVHSCQEPVDA